MSATLNTPRRVPPDHEFPLADVGGADDRQPPPVDGGSGRDRDDAGNGSVFIAALALLVALLSAALVTFFAIHGDGDDAATIATAAPATAAAPAATPAHDMADMADMAGTVAGDEAVEPFQRVDPELPAIPEGKVKRFELDVFEHVTKVSDDHPATRVWSYAINGVFHRGTGASTPMVVTEGDEVEIVLKNGSNAKMNVQYPHSVDYHSAEVAPNRDYKTIAPGETYTYRFTADHPGVFMYHCATDPVLLHTAAGMMGMMVVKPKDLAPVDRELWITQQEFYLGPRVGDNADYAKAKAKQADVIAFNGYANQYKKAPISVQPGERIRMYVLNAGPSIGSAFHVIGTVFDRTVIEGQVGHDAQTVSLAPSQGGWVELTLPEKGTYPFVNHAFADMEKGAAGVLAAGVEAKPGMGH